MTIQLSVAARNAKLSGLNTDIGANAIIEIRSGTRPANVAAAATGTLLATLTGNASGFGTVSGGQLTANAIASDTDADATGTATWARVYTSGAVAKMDVDVGTAGPAELVFATTSFVEHAGISLSSFVLTEANA